MTGRPRISVPHALLTGVSALAAVLAAGHVVAAFVGRGASPYPAVGNAAIELMPSWLEEWAVRTFGTADKLVLLGGMAVVLVLLAVVAGLVSRRRPGPGTVLIAALGIMGGAAVHTRTDVGELALLAPLASLLAGIGTFRFLHARAPAQPAGATESAGDTRATEHTGSRPGPGRRRFLLGAGGVAAGAGCSGSAGTCSASPGTRRRPARPCHRCGRFARCRPSRRTPTSPSSAHPRSSPRTRTSTASTPPWSCRRCGPRTGRCGCTAWSAANCG